MRSMGLNTDYVTKRVIKSKNVFSTLTQLYRSYPAYITLGQSTDSKAKR